MPNRSINHHAYVAKPFADIRVELDERGLELVEAATRTAAAFAADLAGYLEKRLGFFDRDERVHVELGPVEPDDQGATVDLTWQADGSKRLLPNVEATLHVTPLISAGAAATSEVALRGSYTPPRARRAGMIEQALARRLVDATLHTFLRHLADALEDDDERRASDS